MKKRLMTSSAVLALLMGLGAAQAATYIVTNNADSGAGSLRDAINQANASVGVADTIVFSFSGTITLGSMLPRITDELTIDGTGRSITISGGGAVQVMDNRSTLTLNALTIANGRCDRFLFCSTGGGGVYSPGGTLTVTNSTFSGNTADSPGGGAIRGGGTLTIRNSTFSGNSSSSSFGGAIAVESSVTQLTITNSTFANNSGANGGALSVINGAVATVTHSTLSGNATSVSGRGAAIYIGGAGARLSLANSIVAGGGANGNCAAAVFGGVPPIDLGGNLSDDATCGFTQGTSANDTLPQLGPLQDNGGPTLTMLPLTGSPAIGLGVNQLAIDAGLTTDQRGQPRVAPVGGTVDRGAVEVAGLYSFTGFFAPVDNAPTVNLLKAGSAVPLKFSLNGYQGLAIFAAGSPSSQAVACSGGMGDAVEETVTAGGSSLSYDTTSNQYKYVWKTDKAWKGTCRKLVLQFNDGSVQQALFQFN